MDNSDRKIQLFMIQLQREKLTKTIEWEQLFSKEACRFQRGPKRRFFLTRLLFYLIIIGRIHLHNILWIKPLRVNSGLGI